HHQTHQKESRNPAPGHVEKIVLQHRQQVRRQLSEIQYQRETRQVRRQRSLKSEPGKEPFHYVVTARAKRRSARRVIARNPRARDQPEHDERRGAVHQPPRPAINPQENHHRNDHAQERIARQPANARQRAHRHAQQQQFVWPAFRLANFRFPQRQAPDHPHENHHQQHRRKSGRAETPQHLRSQQKNDRQPRHRKIKQPPRPEKHHYQQHSKKKLVEKRDQKIRLIAQASPSSRGVNVRRAPKDTLQTGFKMERQHLHQS